MDLWTPLTCKFSMLVCISIHASNADCFSACGDRKWPALQVTVESTKHTMLKGAALTDTAAKNLGWKLSAVGKQKMANSEEVLKAW